MPLVLLTKNSEVVDRQFTQRIVKALPTIVAQRLTCRGGALTRADIEVQVRDFAPIDLHTKDMEIIIWANEYLGRKKNLDVRCERIIKDINQAMGQWGFAPDKRPTGFVWVLLAPASYGEF